MADKWFSVLRALISLSRICTVYYLGQNRALFVVEQKQWKVEPVWYRVGLKTCYDLRLRQAIASLAPLSNTV